MDVVEIARKKEVLVETTVEASVRKAERKKKKSQMIKGAPKRKEKRRLHSKSGRTTKRRQNARLRSHGEQLPAIKDQLKLALVANTVRNNFLLLRQRCAWSISIAMMTFTHL